MIPLPQGTVLFDDADAVARAAADHLRALCASAPHGRIAVCLSGGSTPRRLYTALAGAEYADLPWSRLHWFFGDDRAVAAEDDLSNVRMAREALGPASAIPAGQFHPIPMADGPHAAAGRYEAALKAFYGAETLDPARPLFDLVLLGLGEDGHVASLFPGQPALEETTAWVVAVPEAGMTPFVPRVSLTFPALASARSVLLLVSGPGKRDPLARLAAGEDLPAARVRGPVRWFVDRAAADV
ncbi:6-phosphogluconolactonase [Methylobacterium sp. Leaf466]|uniref:6-phosphogluconolactonase n=1 Tax=Methylobacterium sp. Leaf466 TaxID=1736386 RepID=UPI0006FA4859|nr:6-phosphogluconolactonase [Methylobacterium sp. Leaf466]KQT77798.1 6-phosphogluconolactonase [Methylobacterium sp. Leaf466]